MTMEEILKKILDEVTVIRVMCTDLQKIVDGAKKQEARVEDEKIKDCGLSYRLTKALITNGVRTVGDLKVRSLDEISKFKNLGQVSINELAAFYAKKFGKSE